MKTLETIKNKILEKYSYLENSVPALVFDDTIKALSEIGIDGAKRLWAQSRSCPMNGSVYFCYEDKAHAENMGYDFDMVEHAPIAAQILQLKQENEELSRKLNISENDELRMIGERDFWQQRVDELADALGDDTEWTSHNCRFENALELAHEKDQKIEQLEADINILNKQLADERSGDCDKDKTMRRLQNNLKIIEDENKRLREALGFYANAVWIPTQMSQGNWKEKPDQGYHSFAVDKDGGEIARKALSEIGIDGVKLLSVVMKGNKAELSSYGEENSIQFCEHAPVAAQILQLKQENEELKQIKKSYESVFAASKEKLSNGVELGTWAIPAGFNKGVGLHDLNKISKPIVSKIEQLESENKRLRDALGFYANATWIPTQTIQGSWKEKPDQCYHSFAVDKDGGEIAREALSGKGEG